MRACRWLAQSCAFVAVFGSSYSSSGSLVAFRLSSSLPQPAAFVSLRSQHSNCSTAAQQVAAGTSSKGNTNANIEAAAVTPCCMEVFSMAAGSCAVLTSCTSTAGSSSSRGAAGERSFGSQHSSTSSRRGQQGHGAKVAVAVGYIDGSSCLYQLGAGWGSEGQGGQQKELEALKALVACW